MNPIQSILVHVDGTGRSAARVRFARDLATLHQSTLTALFAVAPRFIPLSMDAGITTMPLADEISPEHRARARSAVQHVFGASALPIQWHEIGREMPTPAFVRRAFVSDLLVLGQRDPLDAEGFDVPADFVESVIAESGRPAWVVPRAGEASADPQTVLIAWKPTREAARAVTAALPVLRRARRLHVMCAAETVVDTHVALAQLRQYLGVHGIVPTADHHGAPGRDGGEALLSLAADVGAELLVMGCYGHGRARELVLGGVSRTVLRSMTVPALMAH